MATKAGTGMSKKTKFSDKLDNLKGKSNMSNLTNHGLERALDNDKGFHCAIGIVSGGSDHAGDIGGYDVQYTMCSRAELAAYSTPPALPIFMPGKLQGSVFGVCEYLHIMVPAKWPCMLGLVFDATMAPLHEQMALAAKLYDLVLDEGALGHLERDALRARQINRAMVQKGVYTVDLDTSKAAEYAPIRALSLIHI